MDTYIQVLTADWERLDSLLLDVYDVKVRYSENRLEMADEAIEAMKTKVDEARLLMDLIRSEPSILSKEPAE